MSQPLSTVIQDESMALDGFENCTSDIPRLPSAHLPRERLQHELLARPQRLRLLCAPAGYGKTVLLNECLRQRDAATRCLWLDLAGQSLTLAQFCARLVERLGTDTKHCRNEADLLALLEHREDTLWLALDDFPADACAELDAWIDRLLRSSARVQLWVTCRQRPNWKLARLLLEGELLELGAGQLAFSRDEFEAVVELLDPGVPDSCKADLWRQTLGWCAGARLLLNVQGRNERAGALWMRDYLGGELLARLSEDEHSLLLRLAYLPRVSVDLCAQLWPEQEAGVLLRNLLQTQPFFVPLGKEIRWYRLLPAVALALQGELSSTEVSRLRLDGCRLLCAEGFIDEAIELALCADQPDVAACFMERLTLDWMLSEKHLHTWLDWHARLPLRLLESTPNLIYLNARALLSSWRLDEAQACIARLAGIFPLPKARHNVRLLANWQALYGALQGLMGNAYQAREHCESALQHLELRDWQSSFLCYSTLARVSMAAGEPEQARRLLQSSLNLARRQGCLASEVLINADRIRQLILSDELELAEALLQDCFALVMADGGHHDLLLSRLLLLRGELYLLRGDLDICESALTAGLERGFKSDDPYVLHGLLGLSEVAACRGDMEQAQLQLRSAERHMQRARVEDSCYRGLIDYQQLRLLARQGAWEAMLPLALAASTQTAGASRLPPLHAPSLPQRIQLLLALAEFGTGRLDAATRRLQALLVDCERLRFRGLTAEARVALARIEQEQGSEAVSPAPALVCTSLLADWASYGGSPALFKSRTRDELTSREFSVLELVALGLSNQEISERLFISLNTVKAHTVNINHKLGVKRRTQAVMRAKSMGMLA